MSRMKCTVTIGVYIRRENQKIFPWEIGCCHGKMKCLIGKQMQKKTVEVVINTKFSINFAKGAVIKYLLFGVGDF